MTRIVSRDRLGNEIYLYPDDNTSYFKNKRYFNDDPDLIKFLYKTIRKGWTVFDVGAMRGYITVLAGNIVKNSGQVHSFEPEKKNYKRLLENISLNNLHNVITNNIGVYDKITSVDLNIFKERGWHSIGLPIFNGRKIQAISKQRITTVTIDSYCRSRGINHVDLIKIDVEGAEKNVLMGSKELLSSRSIDVVVFEIARAPLEGMRGSVEELHELITGFNYSIYSLGKDAKINFERIMTEADLDIAFGNFVALPN